MPSMMFSTSCTVFVEPAPMPTVTAVVPVPVIVVCPVEKVMVVPSIVRVLPLTSAVPRSLDEGPAVPTSCVAPVIGAAPDVLSLFTTVPVAVLLVNGDRVPIASGFVAKSAALMPPAAVMVPAADVVLAGVFGWVGRLAA